MTDIINFFILISVYFFFHLLIFRYFKVNINNILSLILIFFLSIFVISNFYSVVLLMGLISLNLFLLSFYILFPGIINNGPALVLLDIIIKNKFSTKKKIKTIFKTKASNSMIQNRLKINIDKKFILKKKNKLFLSKKGKLILNFFFYIIKIFNLKIYE